MGDVIDFGEIKDAREIEQFKKDVSVTLDEANQVIATFFTPGGIAMHREGGPPIVILGVTENNEVSGAYYDASRKQMLKRDFPLDQVVQIMPNWIHR